MIKSTSVEIQIFDFGVITMVYITMPRNFFTKSGIAEDKKSFVVMRVPVMTPFVIF